MMMSCAGCSKLSRCNDAPKDMSIIQHTCEMWETTSSDVLRARENIYTQFGSVARQAYRKEKKNIIMQPNDIIANVQAGNVEAIEALRNQPKLQPTALMLAAGKLTGDSAGIAVQLRDAKNNDERLTILIDILVAKAVVISESQNEEPEPEPAPAPKKRRASRRKKVEPVGEEAQADAIDKAKAEEKTKEDKKVVSLQDIDLTPIKDAISELASIQETRHVEVTKAVDKTKSEIADLLEATQALNSKLNMIKDAFIGFEIELIGSGTIGDTPFAKATENWED